MNEHELLTVDCWTSFKRRADYALKKAQPLKRQLYAQQKSRAKKVTMLILFDQNPYSLTIEFS